MNVQEKKFKFKGFPCVKGPEEGMELMSIMPLGNDDWFYYRFSDVVYAGINTTKMEKIRFHRGVVDSENWWNESSPRKTVEPRQTFINLSKVMEDLVEDSHDIHFNDLYSSLKIIYRCVYEIYLGTDIDPDVEFEEFFDENVFVIINKNCSWNGLYAMEPMLMFVFYKFGRERKFNKLIQDLKRDHPDDYEDNYGPIERIIQTAFDERKYLHK